MKANITSLMCVKSQWLKKLNFEKAGLVIGLISAALSLFTFFLSDTKALSLSQFFVGVVLAIQSFLAGRKANRKIEKIIAKIEELGMSIVDSPEYLYAMVDAEDHVIFCVRRDGTIDWALGVPQPIRKEMERLEKKIDEQK